MGAEATAWDASRTKHKMMRREVEIKNYYYPYTVPMCFGVQCPK